MGLRSVFGFLLFSKNITLLYCPFLEIWQVVLIVAGASFCGVAIVVAIVVYCLIRRAQRRKRRLENYLNSKRIERRLNPSMRYQHKQRRSPRIPGSWQTRSDTSLTITDADQPPYPLEPLEIAPLSSETNTSALGVQPFGWKATAIDPVAQPSILTGDRGQTPAAAPKAE